MDSTTTADTAALVQCLRATLASMSAQLDDLAPHLPPLECTWQGTARASYEINLQRLYFGFQLLQQHVADALAAATRAEAEI